METLAPTSLLPRGGCSVRRWAGIRPVVHALIVALVISVCAVVGTATVPSTARAATEVNTCGQAFSGRGFLAADLDCTGFVGDAVTIQHGTLDLQGFTLTAGFVQCIKSCTIESSVVGGLITGGRISSGGFNAPLSNIRVIGLTMSDGPMWGVFSGRGSVKLIDSVISNSGGRGVDALRRIRLLRSTVTGSVAEGVGASSVKLIDSEVNANGVRGIVAGVKITLKRSVVSNNVDAGIAGNAFVIKDSTISGNGGPGIFSGNGRAKLMGSDVSDNGEQGILRLSGKMSIRDSTITGNALEGINQGPYPLKVEGSTISSNGLDGVFGPGFETLHTINNSTLTGNGTDLSVCGVTRTCADVTTAFLPRLNATVCDTSHDFISGFPGTSWGLCALD